jgi:hypothetical protein
VKAPVRVMEGGSAQADPCVRMTDVDEAESRSAQPDRVTEARHR